MNPKNIIKRAFKPVVNAIDMGNIPGAVLGIVNEQGEQAVCSYGLAQRLPIERAMCNDTWFDLASLTKVIFTTPRILALSEAGAFSLDDPLIAVLPDFRQYNNACWERKVTFRQCLGHQTPFPAVMPIYTYGRDPNLLRAFVLQHEWQHSPSCYSDINFILLGLVLERIEQTTLWSMDSGEGFAFSANPLHCAATEHCTWRHRMLCGEVHDDNCSALQGAGHAGLFGTARSVLNYAQSLLANCGHTPRVVELMKTALSSTRTHGWERSHDNWSGGQFCSESTIGHLGFTGTGLWVDFQQGVAWTLLTNRIHPTRHADSGIMALRKAVGNALQQAIKNDNKQ